jgi:hypothetical protein
MALLAACSNNEIDHQTAISFCNDVHCPFCGEDHSGKDYLIIKWSCCGHTLTESMDKARENLAALVELHNRRYREEQEQKGRR